MLANDPDGDRLAAAERQPSGHWHVFSGNDIGTLLGVWQWEEWRRTHPDEDASNAVRWVPLIRYHMKLQHETETIPPPYGVVILEYAVLGGGGERVEVHFHQQSASDGSFTDRTQAGDASWASFKVFPTIIFACCCLRQQGKK